MSKLPLISCLCATKNKLHILKKAIACFRAQTYRNKELIILKQGNDKKTSSYIKNIGDPRISYIQIPTLPELTLGELRNILIEHSKGEYFCGWDDDDWQHKERLTIQVKETLKNHHPASALTNLLAFDEVNKAAYFTTFRLWEGTILCNKGLFRDGVKYTDVSKGEDNGLLRQLLQKTRIYPVVSSTLYIYLYHGNNTWDINHFNKNVFRQRLSIDATNIISQVIKNPDIGLASTMLNSSVVPFEINYFHKTII